MPTMLPFARLFVSASLIAASPVFAAKKGTTELKEETAPASGSAASVIKPITFQEYDLPNGLHVILHENHQAPVVATYVLYHVGSKNERADRTGFAHFFEHLMFEGSENIPRGKIDKYISGAGGNLNASTSFDQTDYFFNLPANQLELALWIESERMMHAKIDETGVETQRQVVKEERRRGVDNQPYGTLFENLAGMVFKGTSYAWTPIGSAQYIDQATIDEFRDFYKTYYLPNNATLSIAGDIDIAKTKELVEGYFGPISKGADIKRPKIDWSLKVAATKKDVEKENTPLPASLHAWRAPKETEPDAYALDLLGSILSKGRSSRLYRRLVDQEQVAVNVDAFAFLQEQAGLVGVFATGQRGVALDQLDSIIADEIKNVREKGVTEEEYQKVRNQQEADFATSFGSVFSRAKSLARYHVFYGDTNLINTELDRYLKVKRSDLQRVAKEYLRDDRVQVLRYPVPGAEGAAGSPKSQEPGAK